MTRSGLHKRLLWDDGSVIDHAWRTAMAGHEFVGTCKGVRCGGQLVPAEPYDVGRTVWYPARCNACGAEPAAHGPRPAKVAKEGA